MGCILSIFSSPSNSNDVNRISSVSHISSLTEQLNATPMGGEAFGMTDFLEISREGVFYEMHDYREVLLYLNSLLSLKTFNEDVQQKLQAYRDAFINFQMKVIQEIQTANVLRSSSENKSIPLKTSSMTLIKSLFGTSLKQSALDAPQRENSSSSIAEVQLTELLGSIVMKEKPVKELGESLQDNFNKPPSLRSARSESESTHNSQSHQTKLNLKSSANTLNDQSLPTGSSSSAAAAVIMIEECNSQRSEGLKEKREVLQLLNKQLLESEHSPSQETGMPRDSLGSVELSSNKKKLQLPKLLQTPWRDSITPHPRIILIEFVKSRLLSDEIGVKLLAKAWTASREVVTTKPAECVNGIASFKGQFVRLKLGDNENQFKIGLERMNNNENSGSNSSNQLSLTFLVEELVSQKVSQRVFSFKDSKDKLIVAQLTVRMQFIHDMQKLRSFWLLETDARIEQINKYLVVVEQRRKRVLEDSIGSHKTDRFSLSPNTLVNSNEDGRSSSYFQNNQFYIK